MMNILDDPTWFIYGMHISAIITAPVNFAGLLIIIFCQSKQIGHFKRYLLIFQIFAIITDFSINVGSLPIIYSPFPIGRPHGIFKDLLAIFGFETSTKAQCIIIFILIFLTSGSVELLFVVKYQSILPMNHSHKLTGLQSFLLVLFFQVIMIFLMLVSFEVAVPDQVQARIEFIELYPSYAYLLQNKHSLIIAIDVKTSTVVFLTLCFGRVGWGILWCGVAVFCSYNALSSLIMSLRTKKLHILLIRNLCYQSSIPFVTFYGALLVVITPLIFTIPNSQPSYFISLLVLSFHTFLGTCGLLYFNKPYRYWVVKTLKYRRIRFSISDRIIPITSHDDRRIKLKEMVRVSTVI